MKEALSHIDAAFGVLRQISVREDDVERMMFAKQELKSAYTLIKENLEENVEAANKMQNALLMRLDAILREKKQYEALNTKLQERGNSR